MGKVRQETEGVISCPVLAVLPGRQTAEAESDV